MILHIVHDDKFIDIAYTIFEAASPGNNEFIILTNNRSRKYIKKTPIKYYNPIKLFDPKFYKILKKYEFIVFHSLKRTDKIIIIFSNKKNKYLWLGWGYDYYKYFDKCLLQKKTKIIQKKIFNILENKKDIIKNIKSKIKKYILEYNNKYYLYLNNYFIFRNIDYFSPVIYDEYKMMKTLIKRFRPKYVEWNYIDIENCIIYKNIKIDGNNILLGNSATYENNHIEIIDLLSKLNIGNRKIICPLSYGSKEYSKAVTIYGKEKLGDKFIEIREYLSIEKYYNILSTCSIAIMNHLRQQGLGNIIIMMYLGATIFLNEDNPLYTYLKNKNAIIYKISEINEINITKRLSENEMQKNRKIVEMINDKNAIIEKTIKIIKNINIYKK